MARDEELYQAYESTLEGAAELHYFFFICASQRASLLSIGALILKCTMLGGVGMFVGAKAVLRFRGNIHQKAITSISISHLLFPN